MNGQISVEFINPFVIASFSVFSMLLGEPPQKGQISAQSAHVTSNQVNVVVGVTGDAIGTVILGMSLTTADKIASQMIGEPVKSFDQLAASAVAELGNMICGNALLAFSESGIVCDLAPPTIIRGTSVEISTLTLPAIVIPMELTHGTVSLTVGLRKVDNARKAA